MSALGIKKTENRLRASFKERGCHWPSDINEDDSVQTYPVILMFRSKSTHCSNLTASPFPLQEPPDPTPSYKEYKYPSTPAIDPYD